MVCRIYHTERLVEYQDSSEEWRAGDIQAARPHLRFPATAQTEMVVRRGRQKKAKWQQVPVEIRAYSLRLTCDANVRREGPSEEREKSLWLVGVRLPKTHFKPWLLITDWLVEDAESAVRIFRLYRQQWAVEDSFKFTKHTLGWEEVQLRKDRKPGKITLVRGLRGLMDTIATRSFLDSYAAEHGHLPFRIAAMLRHAPPGEL